MSRLTTLVDIGLSAQDISVIEAVSQGCFSNAFVLLRQKVETKTVLRDFRSTL